MSSMQLRDEPVSMAYNSDVERFRNDEYPMLKDKVYLDHAGTTLYSKSLIEAFSRDLITHLYGNPHSDSAPSTLSGHRVEEIRQQTLQFFNADPDHFDLIFVSNATAAIRLVAECLRDHQAVSSGRASKGFWYGYHRDAHTSLVGVRELTNGHHHCFRNDDEVARWVDETRSGSFEAKIGPRGRQIGLFAYPGQSNMTGRRLPLQWPGKIRQRFGSRIYTLLDAAALATTCTVDLSNDKEAPDFTAVSFYKIFGFPNIGALMVRREAGHVLQNRRYFGGGTVDMVISLGSTWHKRKETTLHDSLEEGTLPFLSIIALGHALEAHRQLYGSMSQISKHTAFLAKRLYDRLNSLTHTNGRPVCRIYKDAQAIYGDPKTQGATMAFNVMTPQGSIIPYNEVERKANDWDIYLRSGSLCNPGGFATYLDFSASDMKAAYTAGHRCSQPLTSAMGKSTGVVRTSLGAMSTIADVDTFLHFLGEVYIRETSAAAVTVVSPNSSVSDICFVEKTAMRNARQSYIRLSTGRWIRKITRPFSSRVPQQVQ